VVEGRREAEQARLLRRRKVAPVQADRRSQDLVEGDKCDGDRGCGEERLSFGNAKMNHAQVGFLNFFWRRTLRSEGGGDCIACFVHLLKSHSAVLGCSACASSKFDNVGIDASLFSHAL